MDYDIMKGQKKEGSKPSFVVPSVDPNLLKSLGVETAERERKHVDPETAEKCQRLIFGATQLMYRRHIGQEEFGLSTAQYDKWQNDVRELSRQVISGEKTYEDLHGFIASSINMPEEK